MFNFRCSSLDDEKMIEHLTTFHCRKKSDVSLENYKKTVPEGYYELYQCPNCVCKGFSHQDMLHHKCKSYNNMFILTERSTSEIVQPMKRSHKEEAVPSQRGNTSTSQKEKSSTKKAPVKKKHPELHLCPGPHCHYIAVSQSEMNVHNKKFHERKFWGYECPCGYQYSSTNTGNLKRGLRKHRINIHGQADSTFKAVDFKVDVPGGYSSLLRCPMCDKQGFTIDGLGKLPCLPFEEKSELTKVELEEILAIESNLENQQPDVETSGVHTDQRMDVKTSEVDKEDQQMDVKLNRIDTDSEKGNIEKSHNLVEARNQQDDEGPVDKESVRHLSLKVCPEEECVFTYYDHRALLLHKVKVHTLKYWGYQCTCGKQFTQFQSVHLKEHRKIHGEDFQSVNIEEFKVPVPDGYYDTYICPNCYFACFTFGDLQEHSCNIVKEAAEKMKMDKASQESEAGLNASDCNKMECDGHIETSQEGGVEENEMESQQVGHQMRETKNLENVNQTINLRYFNLRYWGYSCPCGWKSNNKQKYSFRQHLDSVHGKNKSDIAKYKVHIPHGYDQISHCGKCNFRFFGKVALEKHSCPVLLTCPESGCKDIFTKPEHFVAHEKDNHCVKYYGYECSCGFQFAAIRMLIDHRKIVHGEEESSEEAEKFKVDVPGGYYNLFKCPNCDARGFSLENLKKHSCQPNTDGSKEAELLASLMAAVMASNVEELQTDVQTSSQEINVKTTVDNGNTRQMKEKYEHLKIETSEVDAEAQETEKTNQADIEDPQVDDEESPNDEVGHKNDMKANQVNSKGQVDLDTSQVDIEDLKTDAETQKAIKGSQQTEGKASKADLAVNPQTSMGNLNDEKTMDLLLKSCPEKGCEFTYHESQKLLLHKALVHIQKYWGYSCPCGFQCSQFDSWSFTRHRKECHGEDIQPLNVEEYKIQIPEGYCYLYKCPSCKCNRFTVEDLQKHTCQPMDAVASKSVDQEENQREDVLKCSVPGCTYSTSAAKCKKGRLKAHEARCHVRKFVGYVCSCGFKYSKVDKNRFMLHREIEHGVPRRTENYDEFEVAVPNGYYELHRCPTCIFKTFTAEDLEKHQCERKLLDQSHADMAQKHTKASQELDMEVNSGKSQETNEDASGKFSEASQNVDEAKAELPEKVYAFKCKTEGCTFTADTKIKLKKHNTRFHLVKYVGYACSCGFQFSHCEKAQLIHHREKVHGVARKTEDLEKYEVAVPDGYIYLDYHCRKCKFRGFTAEDLKKHQCQPKLLDQSHADMAQSQHKDTKVSQELDMEVIMEKSQETNEDASGKFSEASQNVDGAKFKCKTEGCTFTADTKIKLKKHNTRFHLVKYVGYACSCGLQFSQCEKAQLIYHREQVHGVSRKTEDLEKYEVAVPNGYIYPDYRCGKCKFRGFTAEDLEKHQCQPDVPDQSRVGTGVSQQDDLKTIPELDMEANGEKSQETNEDASGKFNEASQNVDEAIAELPEKFYAFKCKTEGCTFTADTKIKLKKHNTRFHLVKYVGYACSCDLQFSHCEKGKLIHHREQAHGVSRKTEDLKKYEVAVPNGYIYLDYCCSKCKFRGFTAEDLEKHQCQPDVPN